MRHHARAGHASHPVRTGRDAQSEAPAGGTPIFHRLASLASLRDHATGRYRDSGLAQTLGEDATDRFLQEQHRRTFRDWLALNLEQQHSEFESFLSFTGGHRRQILVMCAVLTPHSWYVPPGVPEHEARLFLADFAALMELLYVRYGLLAAERDAAPGAQITTDYCELW